MQKSEKVLAVRKEVREVVIKNYNIDKMADITSMAKALKQYVVSKNLYTTIKGKNYTHVDAWQVSGGMLGLFSKVVKVTNLSTDKETKWMAEVEIVDKADKVISRGFAICSKKESKKSDFDEYSILSMAQTRAIGKAYRNTIGYVMKLAGYESTPSEEMRKVGETVQEPPIITGEPVIDRSEPQTLKKGQVIGPGGKPTYVCSHCSDPISDQVYDYSMKVYKKPLCREGQAENKKK